MEHGELNHLFQEVFSDAYSLGREVGQGTFSKVYEVKGYDLQAVVKINWVDQAVRENMGASQAEKPAAFRAVKSIYLEHVKNEIRFLEQLRDSGVVTELLDYRIHEQALTHETIAFIVLRQYQSVEQLMELGVRFDEMELIRLGQDICQALVLFEAYDILHRDIKPSNIFYEMKEGHRHYLLGDLGIARDQSGHYVVKHGLQGSMTACGSDGYIPPEVQKHETLVGKNWDIYSLGMTLRNLTIGQIAGSWSQVRVSRPMKQIMERATADNPHRRYQRPDIMLRQLRQLKKAYGAGTYQGGQEEQGLDVTLHRLPMLALEHGNTFTVEYRNHTHPGKAMVIVQGTGNLYGRVVKYFTIQRKLDPGDFDIHDKNSFSGNCFIYKGKAIRPVINHPDKMKEGRDYTITYQNNAHPGSGLAIVTGKGKYCGRVRLRFNIFLARIENLQATNTPKGVRLLWGQVRGANGYRVYRTRLSDGSSSCIGTVSRGNVTSFVDKKAQAREPLTYYVYASYTSQGKTGQGLGSKVLATAYIPQVDLRQTYFEKKSKSISICCPWKSVDSDVSYKLELSRNKRFRGFQEVNMGKTKKGKRILMKISGSAGSFKKGAYYYVRVRAYTNIVYEDSIDHYRKIRVYSCYSKVRKVKFQ